MTQQVPPSISATAFSCPHCGAYASQSWFELHGSFIRDGERRTPLFPTAEGRKRILASSDLADEQREGVRQYIDKVMAGLVFLDSSGAYKSLDTTVGNLHLSKCYSCGKIAVWVHDRMVFPAERLGIAPNPDLPDELIRDFDEARGIVNTSPRGAAALLRLVIQKLCAHLGEKGNNIDDDIASLVAKGLNPVVQKALDVVRVIGNEAVHPGTIDLKDDRDTALRLFQLVNAIAEQMISHPKSVDDLYALLPESKRTAIEARNEKAKKGD